MNAEYTSAPSEHVVIEEPANIDDLPKAPLHFVALEVPVGLFGRARKPLGLAARDGV